MPIEEARPTEPPPPRHRHKFALYDPEVDPSKEKKSKIVEYRYDGEGLKRPVADPRLDKAQYELNKARNKRISTRNRLERVEYEYDVHSTGKPPQPPAAAIMIIGLSPLTVLQKITQTFTSYGRIADASLKINPATGGSLGICLIKYCDEVERWLWTSRGRTKVPAKAGGQDGHACAQLAMQKMHGQKAPHLTGPTADGKLRIVLDGQGELAEAAAKAELKRRKDAEEAKRKAAEDAKKPPPVVPEASASSASTPLPNGHTESPAGAKAAPVEAVAPQWGSDTASPYSDVRSGADKYRPAQISKPKTRLINSDPWGVNKHKADPWGVSNTMQVSPSSKAALGPMTISPTRAPAINARLPQRLPASATKISPGGMRLADLKGKNKAPAADNDSSSSEDEESDSEEAQRQREKDDKVFFHNSRKPPLSATRPLASTPAKEEVVEQPDPDLQKTKSVMIQLAKQQFPYLTVKKADARQTDKPDFVPTKQWFEAALAGVGKPAQVG